MANSDSKTFCPLLFNGLYIDTNGRVASCCTMNMHYGDLREDKLENILNNATHNAVKEASLTGKKHYACQSCFDIESCGNSDFSPRINALKHKEDWMNNSETFELQTIDLRWQNTCNLACIMCSNIFSSKWENELNTIRRLTFEVSPEVYKYIYSNISNIKEVYLAGGEPLQMKENVKLLNQFLKNNSNVHIRLNTNLSTIDTPVYRLLKQFPKENIKWNVSVDGELDMYEYVRWPGNWQQFHHNLIELSNTYDDVHCDILVNILNCENVLHLVNNVLLHDIGINPEHIKFTPLSQPIELDVRNYSEDIIKKIMNKTADFMIPHGKDNNYRSTLFLSALNLLTHMNNKNFTKDLDKTREFLLKLDKRRNMDYKALGTYLNE